MRVLVRKSRPRVCCAQGCSVMQVASLGYAGCVSPYHCHLSVLWACKKRMGA